MWGTIAGYPLRTSVRDERGRRTPRGLEFYLILLFALSLDTQTTTAQVIRQEYRIKAALIATLGKCVTWPIEVAPRPGQPLTVGVLGLDPFLENGVNQLDQVAQQGNLQQSPMVVKRFQSMDQFVPCHILFVANEGTPEADAARLADAAKATRGQGVIVVGESPGMSQIGATANLIFDRDKNVIRLEVNPDAARRSGVTLSPDLLRLKIVQIIRDAPNNESKRGTSRAISPRPID